MMRIVLALLCVAPATATISVQQSVEEAQANPIRKVVNMLQMMSKKITAEGKKEDELFDKFMCYCKTGGSTLGTSIAEAEAKVPAVGSDIEEGEAQLKQDKEDLKQAQTDRAAAKAAMAEATGIREKESADFAKEKAELVANIDMMTKATKAIENGMVGFLQTNTAQLLRKFLDSKQDMSDFDRQEVVSFLEGSASGEYAPKSGEITGILKEMTDTMSKTLSEAESDEAQSIKSFDELMAAKTKEVQALSKTIEAKTVRIGDLAVEIAQMKADLSDTQAALLDDKKFLADMDKNCAAKTAEHDANQKLRGEELVALSETIKLLNDDDALELFKKTIPSSASASFVQMQSNAAKQRALALARINEAQKHSMRPRPGLDFIALALEGKKVDFSKVLKMIDDMVATLTKEQLDDDHKKEYCTMQFDLADDKKKGLERSVSDLEKAIEKAGETISTLADEIKALEDGIKALDKSVAEATEQRQEENKDFTELMASDSAAKQLLDFAKNRLNKFYNPALYKAAPKTELIEEHEPVLADVSAHLQSKVAPPSPPATAAAYSKKSEESNGVIAMIDLLIKDLDKEMTEAEAEEKNSQKEYEQTMSDSAEKRAQDGKTLTDKESAKAQTETELEASKEEKAATTKELMATESYIASLHAECDWLIQYFDVRKEARTGEIDSLKNAKAVLSGADFAFVQVQKGNLRG
jgi:septal ring factor EnvC (AmiA/AmiB activator)